MLGTLLSPYQEELESYYNIFLNAFGRIGTLEASPIQITSGIDKTVRFIGSHISNYKNDMLQASLPSHGIYVQQPCLKNKNLRSFEQGDPIKFLSYYSCLGTLHPAKDMGQVFLAYMEALEHPHIKENFETILSLSQNPSVELEQIISSNCNKENITIDYGYLDENRYSHEYGMNTFMSENIYVLFQSKRKKDAAPIPASVFVYMKNIIEPNNSYIDTTTSIYLLLKEQFGLEHLTELFPFRNHDHNNIHTYRMYLDCLLTISVLYSEGLHPSAKHNRNRILKKYIAALKEFIVILEIDEADVCADVQHLLENFLNSDSLTIKLCETIKRFRK